MARSRPGLVWQGEISQCLVRSVAGRRNAGTGYVGYGRVRGAMRRRLARQCKARQGKVSGEAVYGTLMRCKACFGITRYGQRQVNSRCGSVRYGGTRQCLSLHGVVRSVVWQGSVMLGAISRGQARRGRTRYGEVRGKVCGRFWLCMARLDSARLGKVIFLFK